MKFADFVKVEAITAQLRAVDKESVIKELVENLVKANQITEDDQEGITKAILKPGFSFVEVLAACPTAFGRRNRMRAALDIVKFFHERSVIKNDIDPREVPLGFGDALVVGDFVDTERPTFSDNYSLVHSNQLGEWPNLDKNAKA